MHPVGRLAGGVIVLAAATALASLATRFGGTAITAVVAIRFALGVCGAAFLLVGGVYLNGGYYGQAVGHAVAAIGFGIVAAGGEGSVAWLGILLVAAGGVALVQGGYRAGPAAST